MTTLLDRITQAEAPGDARPVRGHPDYVVTPAGRVYSLRRAMYRRKGWHELKPQLDARGKPYVLLTGAGGKTKAAVARLVREAFPSLGGVPTPR